LGNGGCYGLTYAWAVGGNPLLFPKEAGFRIGRSNNAVRWFILEIHYDNAKLQPGIIDQSGVRISFTKNLRENDAGTILLGNVDTRENDIPPGSSAHQVETNCPSECTSQWDHSINVFGDFQHMHNVGKMVWSTVHQDEVQLPGYLNRIEYWEFNFQDYIPKKRVFNPGDRINTHCVYDTTSKTTPVRFGPASSDEMCLEIIGYYPALRVNGRHFSSCGSARGQYQLLPNGGIILVDRDKFSTLCGEEFIWGPDSLSRLNPDIRDPPGGEVRTFGVAPTVCRPATILPLEWFLPTVIIVAVAIPTGLGILLLAKLW